LVVTTRTIKKLEQELESALLKIATGNGTSIHTPNQNIVDMRLHVKQLEAAREDQDSRLTTCQRDVKRLAEALNEAVKPLESKIRDVENRAVKMSTSIGTLKSEIVAATKEEISELLMIPVRRVAEKVEVVDSRL
jgi:hypothetical protein